jgi:hypothetical protein
MKKVLLAVILVLGVGAAVAQYANCWQQYVCGGGGCHWITICR